MAALRRAWHSRDGVAMVGAVEQVGFDVCLQWTGDLACAAAELGVPGAGPLADRAAAAALRQRGWEGDRELAETIDDARCGATERWPGCPSTWRAWRSCSTPAM